MAAAELAAEAGYDRIITGDMGGTSFDVAVVIEGKPAIAENTLLDFRIPLRLPMIDVHTIGAGGGSIAHIDRAGILQVGPESAGANPGPVCWGRGGTQPTVTDANVVLARIDPSRPIGIERESLDIESARAAIGTLGQEDWPRASKKPPRRSSRWSTSAWPAASGFYRSSAGTIRAISRSWRSAALARCTAPR